MRVGVLTGGGDCPGLNAVIRAVVRKGVTEYGYEFVGFRDGWKGPLEGLTTPLGIAQVRGILPRGGTILGSRRTNPFKIEGGVERIKANLADPGRRRPHRDRRRGHPRRRDRSCTTTASTSSACRRRSTTTCRRPTTRSASTPRSTSRSEAIDRLHTTAESHHRVLVVEVMGRHAGWIALHAGHGRRRQRHPHPRAAVRHRRGRRLGRDAVPSRTTRRSSSCAEGALPADGDLITKDADARRVRPRPARRHRRLARHRHRGTHRQGGARRRARPHPARRHPDRVRPRARDPLRPARDRRGARQAVRGRWSRCAAPTSSACRSSRAPASSRPSRRALRRGPHLLRLSFAMKDACIA